MMDSSRDSGRSPFSENKLSESDARSVPVIDALRELAHWGKSQPWVVRIWLFGSRVKGTHRADSDLDIAIEPQWTPELRYCANFQSMVVAIGATYSSSTRELLELVPYEVDLQFYGGIEETPHIHEYLNHCSILIYERA